MNHIADHPQTTAIDLDANDAPQLDQCCIKKRYPITRVDGLNTSEQDWRLHLLANSPAHLFLIDIEQTIIHINFIKIAFEPEQVIGSKLRDWICEESLPQYDWAYQRASESNDVIRVMVRCKDECWWWFSLGPCSTLNNQSVLSVLAIDITEQKLENDASTRDRFHMATLNKLMLAGQMSAAVSHEINQPLSAIANYLDSTIRTLRNKYDIEEQDLSPLTHSLELVVKTGEITKSTRSLMRKMNVKPEVGELNKAVKRATRMLKELAFAKDVNVRLFLCETNPLVHGSNIIIEQIVCNLLTNAIDAIDHGQCSVRDIDIRSSVQDDGSIHLTIADTGTGINPDIASVLFKAFHTSKPEGLGMGLWICRNLIRQSGGDISLVKSDEQGTTFECLFKTALKNHS
ncbi:PAS domain-containing protein [Planctomycetota bacterium]|nr:PAS domain-containing protein [Planctomycetota bacterium]